MPTTWNLGKQPVKLARVFDEGLQRIFSLLEMPGERRQCQVLTQSEVLHFVGWFPYYTSEEFEAYCVEHPELEPFPPYNFGAPGDTSEKDPDEGDGAPRGYSFYVSDQRMCLPVYNCPNFFSGMATGAEKERYKALLGRDRTRARAQQKKRPAALSSSRPANQIAPLRPQQQPPQ